MVARQAHNLKVGGSNPFLAPKLEPKRQTNKNKWYWYVVKAFYGYKGKSYECKCLNLTNHATGETRQYYFIQFLPSMRRKGYGAVERLLLFENQ